MKLSINQYNEIFKDRSATNYAKFNWKGDMPILKEFVFDNVDVYKNLPFHLDPGKYVFEIVNKEITAYGETTYTDTIGIGDFMVNSQAILTQSAINADTSIEYIVTFPNGCDVFNLYLNSYDYNGSLGYKGKIKFIIREYVENLVQTFAYSNATEISKAGDICEFNINDAYGGLSTQLTSSQLAYGDYRFNVNINYIKSISGETPLIRFAVYNETKETYILGNTDNRTGIFTLTPANYAPGDTMRFWFLQYTTGTCSIDVGINNYYVCKIKDDWIVRKGNIATWYPNGGQNCFYEVAEKGSRPYYTERTLFFKNNSGSIVTEFYFDSDGNGIVYISEDMPTSDFNDMMAVVDIMYKPQQ